MKRMFMLALLLAAAGLSAKHTQKPEKTSISKHHETTLRQAADYTVEAGDSLSTIAKSHHTSIQALCEANGIKRDALLHPGQHLKIPAASEKNRKKKAVTAATKIKTKSEHAPQSKQKAKRVSSYKVQAGDTLSFIAQRFGVSSKQLREANKMGEISLIRVGQILSIPTAGERKDRSSSEEGSKAKLSKKSAKSKTVPAQKSLPKEEPHYTVQSGDTLFSIARRYHTPLQDLMSLNGISPTDIIKPGQELKIPSDRYRLVQKEKKTSHVKESKAPATKTVTKKIPPVYYTVRHGDTLWEIAHRQKVTIREIRSLNQLRRGHILHTGEKLMIKPATTQTVTVAVHTGQSPKAPEAKSKKVAKYYTVKHGDSLWKIAKEHKITLSELREMNHLPKGKVIHSGMKLTVGYQEVPLKVAAKKKSVPHKKSVASAKKSKGTKTEVARKKVKAKKSKKRYAKKSADRRINRAMAALNGKDGTHFVSSAGNAVIRTAKRYLGHRYVWGAEGPNTFDCSGFTQYVYRKSRGVRLPRVSRKQAYYGKYVTRSQLRPGDLIFFDTSHRRRGYVNHVGIYIGNNMFIHASSARHRVVITSLNRPFYRARFMWGRRVN